MPILKYHVASCLPPDGESISNQNLDQLLPDITGSLTDICQLHFYDLDIGTCRHILAKDLKEKPDCFLYIGQCFLLRFALTYGPRKFKAPHCIAPLVLWFEDDGIFHPGNS